MSRLGVPEDVREVHEEHESIQKKARAVAEALRGSLHAVVYTGAGISTSAGIPDFRGPQGVWTLRETGGRRTLPTTPTERAIPTFTHMAIVELMKRRLVKHLVSQNVDGLHVRSGVPFDKISELHGNRYIENCPKCGRVYLRGFCTCRRGNAVHDHRTGRTCDTCHTELLDSIINFQENLPEKALKDGWAHSEKADLALVLGTSLRVSPACQLPLQAEKLIICNLQHTPADARADTRVYASTDDLMKHVMDQLEIDVPPFRVCHRIHVRASEDEKRWTIHVSDEDGHSLDYAESIRIRTKDHKSEWKADARGNASSTSPLPLPAQVEVFVTLTNGFYDEPPIVLPHTITHPLPTSSTYEATYDPRERRAWHVVMMP